MRSALRALQPPGPQTMVVEITYYARMVGYVFPFLYLVAGWALFLFSAEFLPTYRILRTSKVSACPIFRFPFLFVVFVIFLKAYSMKPESRHSFPKVHKPYLPCEENILDFYLLLFTFSNYVRYLWPIQ